MKDLTKGNPFKQILLFVLPVMGGNLFQQLYSLADTIIVGNTVNADALTGVGLTGGIGFLIFGFIGGLTAGFGVRVAQRFGAQDEEGVRRAVATAFTLCLIISLLLTAVCAPLTGVFLRLMSTPEQFFDYAYYYLLITLLGIGANMLYNVVAAVLRAIGDSKTPLLFLVLSAFLNVGLDFAFILGCNMRYCGVALSTVLSQLLSGIACLLYMYKRYPTLRFKRGDFKWNAKLVGGHLAVGLPMALQFSITGIGIIFRQTALNLLNSAYPGVVTAYAAASKIDSLAAGLFPALGVAMATFAGQNKGAGDMSRVKKGVGVGMIFALVLSAVGLAFSMGLYRPLMKLFLNTEKGGDAALYYDDMLAYAKHFLLIQGGCYPLLGAVNVLRNALQGIGKSFVTMLAGVTELAGRMLACFLFARLWGFTGVCFTDPVAWLAADIFLAIVYFVVMNAELHRSPPQEACPAESQ